MPFMNPSHPVRSDIRRKGDHRFRPGKGFFKRLDKIGRGQSEGFKETFHTNLLFTDAREESEKVFGLLGIGVKTDVKGLVPIGNRFFDRLENFLHPSEGHLFSAGHRLLGRNVAAAPRALGGAAPAHGEMIKGRLQGIHPEIFLLGDTFYIKGLSHITDIDGVILQQWKIGEGKTVQVFLRCDIGEGIDENPALSPPGKVRDGKEVFFEPIRSPEGIDTVVTVVASLAFRIFRLIINKYFPQDIRPFADRYITQWRTRFLSVPEVIIKDKAIGNPQ